MANGSSQAPLAQQTKEGYDNVSDYGVDKALCQRSRIYRLVNVGNRTRDASVECRIYDVELNDRFETADKHI